MQPYSLWGLQKLPGGLGFLRALSQRWFRAVSCVAEKWDEEGSSQSQRLKYSSGATIRLPRQHPQSVVPRNPMIQSGLRMKKRKQRTRRKIRKRKQSVRSAGNRRSVLRVPRTAEEYFDRPRDFQETWNLIVQVPTRMRSEGVSLSKATRQLGISRSRVLRLAGPAFRRLRNGRYAAKVTDRLLRVLTVPSAKGLIEIGVSDSREASVIGEYWNAVERYLARGDASELQKFRKKRVKDGRGKRVPLVTDLDELARLASAGVLRFESIYGRTA